MNCESHRLAKELSPESFAANDTSGLIDFGMVGLLDEQTQDLLAELLSAINHQDADRLVDVFLISGHSQTYRSHISPS